MSYSITSTCLSCKEPITLNVVKKPEHERRYAASCKTPNCGQFWWYLATGAGPDYEYMKAKETVCGKCFNPLVLQTSKKEAHGGRMYGKCFTCQEFQWWDPTGTAVDSEYNNKRKSEAPAAPTGHAPAPLPRAANDDEPEPRRVALALAEDPAFVVAVATELIKSEQFQVLIHDSAETLAPPRKKVAGSLAPFN